MNKLLKNKILKKFIVFVFIITNIFLLSCSKKQFSFDYDIMFNTVLAKVEDFSKKEKANLIFNKDRGYVIKEFIVDDVLVKFRAYENIQYVKNVVDSVFQVMNIYIPCEYFEDKYVCDFNSKNAPILFTNGIGSFMFSSPREPKVEIRINEYKNSIEAITNLELKALSRGYIVASAGARGSKSKGVNNKNSGKAPAAIVDLKSAVAYLHKNDKNMPGDANRIISCGTSSGGLYSVLLGLTGNSIDYKAYLEQIGAANADTSVFASVSYCPIINLENADIAYEWMFNGINEFKNIELKLKKDKYGNDYVDKTVTNKFQNEEQQKYSYELSIKFPSYVNSLNLKSKQGVKIRLNDNKTGTFVAYLKQLIVESANEEINKGVDLSTVPYLKFSNGQVVDIDFDEYVHKISRGVESIVFDNQNSEGYVNLLFGTEDIDAMHFTDYSKNLNVDDKPKVEDRIIAMLNPMNYITNNEVTKAKHFRIRHGEKDTTSSLANQAILVLALENNNIDIDFKVPWNIGHESEYDIDNLLDYTDTIMDVPPHFVYETYDEEKLLKANIKNDILTIKNDQDVKAEIEKAAKDKSEKVKTKNEIQEEEIELNIYYTEGYLKNKNRIIATASEILRIEIATKSEIATRSEVESKDNKLIKEKTLYKNIATKSDIEYLQVPLLFNDKLVINCDYETPFNTKFQNESIEPAVKFMLKNNIDYVYMQKVLEKIMGKEDEIEKENYIEKKVVEKPVVIDEKQYDIATCSIAIATNSNAIATRSVATPSNSIAISTSSKASKSNTNLRD